MAPGTLAEDERAFSETFAVALLLGITLLMVLTVGIYVLAVGVEDDDSGATAFAYDYDGDSDTLLVRYSEGENLTASTVVLETGNTEATWAELAGATPDDRLESGAAVQLSPNSVWGRPVTDATNLRVHAERDGQRTQISNWSN